jgi:pyruvate dehydrogenase E2 component (dihydrolipoamide acetyltransferase)
MAFEIVMPQLGLSMDSGRIMAWRKESGDYIQPGDMLLEIEGDKAVVEVEAIERGTLQIIKGPEDGDIAVGEVIAYLLAEGENGVDGNQPAIISESVITTERSPTNDNLSVPAFQLQGSTTNKLDQINRPPSSPAARRQAVELNVDWRLATGTGPRGRIKERDVIFLAEQLSSAASGKVEVDTAQISPVARRLAESTGLDIRQLARQHPGKRLERSDVEDAIKQRVKLSESSAAASSKAAGSGQIKVEARREPMSSLRRVIASRMANSSQNSAAVTLTTEADATELKRLREEKKADVHSDVIPSYNTLIVKLVCKALLEHPILNTSLDGETIIYWEQVNIGVAVDTDRGLVVPVVRDVQTKPISQLAIEMNELLPRAKEGKALLDELSGGTFTITNLGVYEIDFFTPIINPPESAVLGIGRLVDRWMVIDREPAIRTMMALSLTFDHRLVDGGPAAQFLQRIKQLVEQPYLWLV